jgi:hypothetical protein
MNKVRHGRFKLRNSPEVTVKARTILERLGFHPMTAHQVVFLAAGNGEVTLPFPAGDDTLTQQSNVTVTCSPDGDWVIDSHPAWRRTRL